MSIITTTTQPSSSREGTATETVALAPSSSKKRTSSSSSSFRGVRKRAWGRYVSEIRLPGQKTRIWLGSFASPEMAARAYDSAAYFIKGESATLNFPERVHSLPRPLSSSRRHIQSAAAKAAALQETPSTTPPPPPPLSLVDVVVGDYLSWSPVFDFNFNDDFLTIPPSTSSSSLYY